MTRQQQIKDRVASFVMMAVALLAMSVQAQAETAGAGAPSAETFSATTFSGKQAGLQAQAVQSLQTTHPDPSTATAGRSPLGMTSTGTTQGPFRRGGLGMTRTGTAQGPFRRGGLGMTSTGTTQGPFRHGGLGMTSTGTTQGPSTTTAGRSPLGMTRSALAVTPAANLAGLQSQAVQSPLASECKIQNAKCKIKGAQPVRRVVVSIPDRKLALLEDGKTKKVYAVAVGADVSRSPAGSFRIVNRLTRPTYYHPGTVIGPGAQNPLGTRWVGLDRRGYGIHGTNQPKSIGKAASHGCIRMARRDLEELFELVRVGDSVEIHGERDEAVAAIFGGAPADTNVAEAGANAADAGDNQ